MQDIWNLNNKFWWSVFYWLWKASERKISVKMKGMANTIKGINSNSWKDLGSIENILWYPQLSYIAQTRICKYSQTSMNVQLLRYFIVKINVYYLKMKYKCNISFYTCYSDNNVEVYRGKSEESKYKIWNKCGWVIQCISSSSQNWFHRNLGCIRWKWVGDREN